MTALLLALLSATHPSPTLTIQDGAAVPGGLLVLDVAGVDRPDSLRGELAGTRLHFFTAGPHHQRALVGLTLEQEPGELTVKVDRRGKGVEPLTATVTVRPKEFRKSELKVEPKFVKPPKSELDHIATDKKMISAAYHGVVFGPAAFVGKLSPPRDAEITAHFGDQRLYNGKKKNAHMGTDFDGKIGDPIQAAADGVVILARDCYYSGNTVIVAHGGGLFTSYFHMSKMESTPGQRGQRLGLVGKTGRVTGPHLHLGVKIGERLVDAEEAFTLQLGQDKGQHPAPPELKAGLFGVALPDGGVGEPQPPDAGATAEPVDAGSPRQ
jgi:murein DD-endopeptidase MepM/ murein hydrolase activator NlpD